MAIKAKMMKTLAIVIAFADVSRCNFIPATAPTTPAAPAGPKEGHCQYHSWGGTSHFHEYVCCNNCHSGGQPESCNGKTYQIGSSTDYCGNCGINKGGGFVHGEEFTCGGCLGQDKVASKCQIWWNSKGWCWAFADCVKSGCAKMKTTNRHVRDIEQEWWCGDGTCNSDETLDNCPIDCCRHFFPDECGIRVGECQSTHCNTSTCNVCGVRVGDCPKGTKPCKVTDPQLRVVLRCIDDDHTCCDRGAIDCSVSDLVAMTNVCCVCEEPSAKST